MADAPHTTPQHRRALALLAAPIVLLGTAWPVNKLALHDIAPLWFAAWRGALSTVVSFALVAVLRQWRWPGLRDVPIILSIGLLQLAGFFALTNVALTYLPAGRSVVLSNTTTLWLVPLALLIGEPIPRLRWAGVAAGLAGVLVLANPWSLDWRDPGIVLGHGLLLLAALGWAIAIFHARRHRWHLMPLQVLPWQMLAATAVLIPLAAIIEPDGRSQMSAPVLVALVYIGAVAGPLGSWTALIVSRDLPTVVSSLGFLGIPALGLLISTTLLGEAMTWSLGLGAGLIGLGVALASLARR